jgi:hypothetical protein
MVRASSDSDSDDKKSKIEAPDGGWGWAVVAGKTGELFNRQGVDLLDREK